MSYNNSQYWYQYNEHGNVIRMTDASGATVVKYKYDAWGNITEKTANSTIANLNPYRYTGAEGSWYDENTNKYFLQARYYDPEIGRFLSKDPVELTIGESNGLNPYVYAINNPVMFIDPSGETSFFNRLKATAGGIITVWVTVRVGTQIAVKKVQKLLFKGTRYVNNTKRLADDIGSKLGGTINNAKGKGYKVQIPNGNKPITVRVMEAGSGGRNKSYFRVSIDGKGSLTLDGKISNDRSLTILI